MKKLAVILLTIVFGLSYTWAQKTDTTKIRMGKKKIIIIENEMDESMQKLENARMEFEKQNQMLEQELDSIAKLKNQENISNEEMRELEANIAEIKAQMRALDEGKKDVDNELKELEKEMENYENNDDEDFDFDFDHDFDEEEIHRKKRKNKFEPHFGGFEFGLNNLLNADYQMDFPTGNENMELNFGKSWTFAINPIEHSIVIIPRIVGLVTGAGLQWNNYHFNNNINLVEDETNTIYAVEETEYEYYKNSLNTFSLNVPLIMEFHIPTGDGLNLGVGVYGSVRLSSKTKQFYKEGGNKYKMKNKDDYQLSPYSYGLTLRFGMKDFQLFANYSMMPLFKENRGPEMYPVSVGLTFPSF